MARAAAPRSEIVWAFCHRRVPNYLVRRVAEGARRAFTSSARRECFKDAFAGAGPRPALQTNSSHKSKLGLRCIYIRVLPN